MKGPSGIVYKMAAGFLREDSKGDARRDQNGDESPGNEKERGFVD